MNVSAKSWGWVAQVTTKGQRSPRGHLDHWLCSQSFGKIVAVSTYFNIFSRDLGTMSFGRSHMWPHPKWVKGHIGVITALVRFLGNSHCFHILWCINMGVGHNDHWVESHMRHQHWRGQRSSKGQLGLSTTWLKSLRNGQYCILMGLGHNDPWVGLHVYHLSGHGVKSIITMIAKVCDCGSRRDPWVEIHLVCPCVRVNLFIHFFFFSCLTLLFVLLHTSRCLAKISPLRRPWLPYTWSCGNSKAAWKYCVSVKYIWSPLPAEIG